jgi:hypothetical protein
VIPSSSPPFFFELMFFAEEIFVEGEKSWSSLRNHDSITSTIFFELRTAVFLAERFGCGRSEERWLFCVIANLRF